MDYSAFLTWPISLLGIFLALSIAKFKGSKTGLFVSLFIAIPAAIGIVVILSLLIAYFHEICINASYCANKGDRNMGVWFTGGLYLSPVYFLIIFLRKNSTQLKEK